MAEKKQTAAIGTMDDAMRSIAEIQAAGPGAAARLYLAWMEGMGDIGSEALQFVAERIAEDVRTQHEILNCRNPTELLAIQRRFLQTALDQYVAEGGKLMKMSNEIVQEAFDRSRH